MKIVFIKLKEYKDNYKMFFFWKYNNIYKVSLSFFNSFSKELFSFDNCFNDVLLIFLNDTLFILFLFLNSISYYF